MFALGRNHPKVKAILQQFIGHDLPNLVRMDCSLLSGLVAEKLTQHAGDDLSRVFFCNSGTESIEGAIKFARCATGRQDIVYCDHAFHGLTTGSLVAQRRRLLPRALRRPAARHAARFRSTIWPRWNKRCRRSRRPRSSSSPCRAKRCEVVADGYLPKPSGSAASTARCWSLDEVQCGLGRTGKWFCFQHWPDVEPDIVCTAKALSGGYVPVGAVITRPKIMDCVFNSMERCVVHSNTFGQNDLAMAAALASLHVIEEDKLVENAADDGRLRDEPAARDRPRPARSSPTSAARA